MTTQQFLQLHPVVQAIMIISIAAAVITFVWQMWKTFRESL